MLKGAQKRKGEFNKGKTSSMKKRRKNASKAGLLGKKQKPR